MRLNNIKKTVADVLLNDPWSRNDDFRLIYKVYRNLNYNMNIPFGEMLLGHNDSQMPSFESIRRCRQMLQREAPLIYGANHQTQKLRQRQEEQYLDFTRGEAL